MYANVHTAFVERPFIMVGAILIATELAFALLMLLFIDLGDHWPILAYQLAGAAALSLAIRRRTSGQSGGRPLIFVGSIPALLFLDAFAFPLGYLAILVWGIALAVSFVA